MTGTQIQSYEPQHAPILQENNQKRKVHKHRNKGERGVGEDKEEEKSSTNMYRYNN